MIVRYAIFDEAPNAQRVVAISYEDPSALYPLGGSLIRVEDPHGVAHVGGPYPVFVPPVAPTHDPADEAPADTPQMDLQPGEPAAQGAALAVDEAAPTSEPHPSDSTWKMDP